MARQRAECMTNSELAALGSIDWSDDEFCVATEESMAVRASAWTHRGRRPWGSGAERRTYS